MAGKTLGRIRSGFHKELGYALKLATLADAVKQAYHPSRGPKLSDKDVVAISEGAFLKIFVAYEIFMEQSFIGYMLGATSPKNYKPKKYILPRDEQHALEMLLQDHSLYADWSNPDKVKKRAKYCFKEGKPFLKPINECHQILVDMRTIRNAIAHQSADASTKFEDLARRYLTTLPINKPIQVGEFLLINYPGVNPPKNFMKYFCDELRDFSNKIAP